MADVKAAMALGLAILASGCSSEPDAAEKARREARDIAQVEAIQKQKPPPRMIAPQPILYGDIERNHLFGTGCSFAPGSSMGAVLLTRAKVAYMKLDDRIVRLASDPGSAKLPMGTWSHYSGKELSVALTRSTESGDRLGSETLRWPGHLTVTDPFDQVVYDEDGQVQCGS